MGRKYLMSWDGSPNFRWVKMYRGVRYRVSCADLGLAEQLWTKEDSYQLANQWWQRLTATQRAQDALEVDADGGRFNPAAEIDAKMQWAAQHDPNLLPRLEDAKKEVIVEGVGLQDADTIAQNIETAKLFGIVVPL